MPAPLTQQAAAWADEIIESRTIPTTQEEIVQQLGRLHQRGLFATRLGVDLGTQRTLLQVLAEVGRASLPLGRLFEGHVNALLLIDHYGSSEQQTAAREDASNGMLFGVWNTGAPELLKIVPCPGDRYQLQGVKTFASGAPFMQRALLTGALPDGGWQMCLVPIEGRFPVDASSWEPLGMEASFSHTIDLSGAILNAEQLIGEPGDFYLEPRFTGGAIRFAAVHLGGAERLLNEFVQFLQMTKRQEDPYQIARAADVAIAVEQGYLWLNHAAWTAEHSDAAEMTHIAAMTRTAIERACSTVINLVTAGVGARGLLRPHAFEQIVRDLTMYLRQPAPDHALASIGRRQLTGQRVPPWRL